jgi:hypothetical protein
MEELVDHAIISRLAAKADTVNVRVLAAQEISSNTKAMDTINAANCGKMLLDPL